MIRTILFTFAGLASAIRTDGAGMIIPPAKDVIDKFRKSLNDYNRDWFDRQQLYKACQHGRRDVVEALFAEGVSILNEKHLLPAAVSSVAETTDEESMKIVQLILHKGAKVNKDAVEKAVFWNHKEALRLFLDLDPSLVKQAFVSCRLFLGPHYRNKPCWTGRGRLTVEWLIEQGYVERAIITVRKNGLIGPDLEFEFNADSTLQDLRSRIAQTMDCSPEHIELYTWEDGRELTNFEGTLSDNGLEDNMELEVDMCLVIHHFIETLGPADQDLYDKDALEVAIRHGRVDVVEALLLNQEPITDTHIYDAGGCLPIYNLLQKHKCIREH